MKIDDIKPHAYTKEFMLNKRLAEEKQKSVIVMAYSFQAIQLIAQPSDNHQGKIEQIKAYLKLMDDEMK